MCRSLMSYASSYINTALSQSSLITMKPDHGVLHKFAFYTEMCVTVQFCMIVQNTTAQACIIPEQLDQGESIDFESALGLCSALALKVQAKWCLYADKPSILHLRDFKRLVYIHKRNAYRLMCMHMCELVMKLFHCEFFSIPSQLCNFQP